ncbi:yemanuclein isoform X2 [Phlebotomus argentipes]|uniref:yemanuclein isoform X2 n=1 Tax=Phlebotomus argentipes TaxID=94469 RepID=UPI002893781C|nr:yemanuclein isoform X2 [Phlebotomus argentipes]
MSEPKRATLATISDVDREKKAANTVRVELKLFEPNADTFPEFNFQALLHAEKKKRKKISKLNGFGVADPFENDDDVARIAKELEKKYGCNSAFGKKHSNRTSADYCDKGAGYDESDSFIDNTEAYDELIPEEVETVRGGFYINSGPLEFQHLSNYERPDDAQRMPKPKKRTLSTSSSSSDEEGREAKATKQPVAPGAPKNGHQEKKLKSVNADDVKVKSSKAKLTTGAEKNRGDQKKSDDRCLKTTTVKDMLRAKRDSLRNMQDAAKRESETDGVDLSSAPMTSESSNESTAIEIPNGTSGAKPETKLPSNLSEDILRNVVLLKESARLATSMGKTNFFDSSVQQTLLKIENAARAAGGHVRNQVYSHLEVYLPCSKQTLMLKAKKLWIQQEEAKVKKAVVMLKKSVEESMPGLAESYEKENERIRQLKSSMAIMGIPENENDLKWPKKQYVWSDTTRRSLNSVVNACRSAFSKLKSRKGTVEEYVLECLKKDVLPIWSPGWMKLEGLLKELEWKIDMKNVNRAVKEGGNDLKPQISGVPVATNLSKAEKVEPKPPLIPASSSTTSFPSNSSLTITPVSSATPASKPLPSVHNKVTITNVEELVKAAAKVPTASSAMPSAPPQLPSGLSISIASSPTPPPPVSVTPSATTVLKTVSKSPPKEATPPPKKSFDYSISSIISSTTSAAAPAPSTVISQVSSAKMEPEKETPVILVEEKAKVEVPPASVLTPIKVRSVATVNSTVGASQEKVNSGAVKPDVIFEDLSSTSSDSSESCSGSSDCEIVESTPDVKKNAARVVPKNLQRPPKSVSAAAASSGASAVSKSRDLDPLALVNDNDIDVNQIMKELKELQEFQQNDSRAATTGGFNSKKSNDISEYSTVISTVRK